MEVPKQSFNKSSWDSRRKQKNSEKRREKRSVSSRKRIENKHREVTARHRNLFFSNYICKETDYRSKELRTNYLLTEWIRVERRRFHVTESSPKEAIRELG